MERRRSTSPVSRECVDHNRSAGRSWPRVILAVAALTILWSLPIAVAFAAPVELLPNGGGEKINEKALPLYFGVQNSGEIRASDLPRSGERAVRLIARPHEWKFSIFTTPNPASYPPDDILRVRVVRGGVYRASVWARGRGDFRLGVQQWPSILGSVMSEPITLTKEWQKVEVTYRAEPREIRSVNLQFRLDGEQAIADIDDASLTFDVDENPGIEQFPPPRRKVLTVRAEPRRVRDVQLFANGVAIPLNRGVGAITVHEGLVALAVRADPAGVDAALRLRIEGHPETDGRWRATVAPSDSQWTSAECDDQKWPLVECDRQNFLRAADWRGFSRTAPNTMFFRQVLLWNETHYGPNRCILPRARRWGFSRGGFENLTLALYSPLPAGLRDFEFVLDVPAGFSVFGKTGDFYTRYILNQKPDRVIEQVSPQAEMATRYRFQHPLAHVRGDAAPEGEATQYSEIPIRVSGSVPEGAHELRFHRRANGNFTELEQRIPVDVLPPINGRQPERFRISAYVGMPLGYSALAPDHLEAFVKQVSSAGWTHCSVSVSSPGCDTWGKDWLAYQKQYLRLCRTHGIEPMLWPWHSFPITGSRAASTEPADLVDWVERTSGARARYFNGKPAWDREHAHMYCPSYVTTEGATGFREIVSEVWRGMAKQMGGTKIIWTDDERKVFTPNGEGSYCFCDRCKEEFRKFANLDADVELEDEALLMTYNEQWRLFWAEMWFGRVHGQLKQVANGLGKQYMVYTWNGSNDRWKAIRGNCDIAFPGMPGTSVMNGRVQKVMDGSMAFYRQALGVRGVQGQIFALLNSRGRKDAWAQQQVISADGFVDARSWKSQLLRLAATLQGGVDLGENPIDYRAGSHYWIGEATRIIDTHEDFFVDGIREDTLAESEEIAYPNLLVLKRENERLVLAFNEEDDPLSVKIRSIDLHEGQVAHVFEAGPVGDAAEVNLVIPPRDAAVIHIR